MNKENLELWRQAESAIGRPRAVERAKAQLPPRLAALLSAIEAFDEGTPEGIAAEAARASEAGHTDIASVLTLALTPKEDIDPTSLRKAAKDRNDGSTLGIPWLDVYRMLAVERSGERAKRPPSLSSLRAERPVLRALCDLASSKEAFNIPPEIGLLSRRAQQLFWAARHLSASGHLFEDCIREVYRESTVLSLPEERWPDSNASAIERWTKGNDPWGDDQEQASQGPSQPTPRLRAVLGDILRRASRDIAAGRGRDLEAPLQYAKTLARQLEPTGALVSQIDALLLRLSVLSEPDLELLKIFWKEKHRLRAAERLLLAEQLALEHPPAALYLAAMSPDLSDITPLAQVARELSHQAFEREIEAIEATPIRRELMRGIYESVVAQPIRAIERLLGMLDAQPPAKLEAETLAIVLFAEQSARNNNGGPIRPDRRLKEHILGLTERLAKQPFSVRVWLSVLSCFEIPISEAIRSAIERSAAEVDSRDLDLAVVALVLSGQTAAADAARTRMGRELRAKSPEQAADLALDWLGKMVNFERYSKAISPYMAPLEALLLKDDASALLPAITRREHGPASAPVLDWLLARRDNPLLAAARRRALAHILLPPDVPPPLVEMLVSRIEEEKPRSFAELAPLLFSDDDDDDDDDDFPEFFF